MLYCHIFNYFMTFFIKQVVKCRKEGTAEVFAIKLIAKRLNNARTIKREVKMLETIASSCVHPETVDDFCIVRFFGMFPRDSDTCLVFESLQLSLRELQVSVNFQPLPMTFVRAVAGQLLNALQKLKTLSIVHTDLKAANIMLVDALSYPYRVKLIDFGCARYACDIGKEGRSQCMQTRPYRYEHCYIYYC